MKNLLIVINFFFVITIYAQTPQIALVKPDGTTSIHTTFQDAYDNSDNNDKIYLPGGFISGLGTSISKKISIFGAGSHIDSSQVTGISTLIGDIKFESGSEGSICEGLKITNELLLNSVSQITIRRCILFGGIRVLYGCSNIAIINNIIHDYNNNGNSSIYCPNGEFNNTIISNNIILYSLSGGENNEINNNIFFKTTSLTLISNSTYNNNIFRSTSANVYNSIFYNNVNITPSQTNGNQSYNVVNETFPEIFIDPGPDPHSFNLENDYHVLETSACHESGTDGTDRGIYGGTYPWVEGMIPSNPHIYFKDVSDQSDENGLLQIHFKVRTND